MRLNVQGIFFNYKAVGENTRERYALTEGIVPPRHGAPEHIHHREDEVFYILEGELKIECGGEVFKATPGTSALLPKGLPHRFQNLADNRGKFFACSPPAGLNSLNT
jgi:mannose-6-phosphate isomerase-like protein (cupin superfamily)